MMGEAESDTCGHEACAGEETEEKMRRGGATRGSWRETPEEKIAGGHAAEADDVRRVRWRGDARDNREVGAGEEGRRGEGLAKGKREGKSAMRDARRAT